jgi:DNA-binding response OmpR family regulator
MKNKILFIEDESALQETFGDLLSREGYEVIKALDGDSGLRLAKSEKPDLILLDLILPRMNGFEVLEGIRKEDDIKDIPVIILTNLESAGDVQKAIEFGAKDYLVKENYKMEEVLEKIKTALK